MKVYRYLSEKELNAILENRTEDLGQTFVSGTTEKMNTHKYKTGVKYLHFFKDKEFMNKIKDLYKNYEGNFYFCSFDIPFIHLMFKGKSGFYHTSGYDSDFDVAKEYAIEVDEFKPEWLQEYKQDTSKKVKTQDNDFSM